MKKLLALILCLIMTFGVAHAELEVPQPKPTQEELQMGFIGSIFSFLPNLNLDEKAFHFEVTQEDQALLDALLQQVDGVFDFNGTVAGTPIRAQFTSDAILVSYEEQVYKLPYQTLMSLGQGEAAVDPTAIMELFTSFVESVIIPSITVESTENGQHIVIDITQEKLAESLVDLGDSIADNDQLLTALGISDFSETWQQLRSMIESGVLQISLHADATIEDTSANIKADGSFLGMPFELTASSEDTAADFLFTLGEITFSGKADIATGAYDFHGVGFTEMSYDIVFQPTEEGWSYSLNTKQGESEVVTCTATLTEAAFDTTLTCNVDGETLTGDIHFDRGTAALDATITCPESMGGIVLKITGEKNETGYHILATVTQSDMLLATVDALYTETDEMMGLELSVTTGEENASELMTASLAYAKATGDFELKYKDVDGTYCNGEGIMTAEQQSCTLDIGRNGRQMQKIVLDRLSNDKDYTYRFTVYQDMRYRGTLDRVMDTTFDLDKETGAFRGTYQQVREQVKIIYQGIFTPGMANFRLDSSAYGRNSGMIEGTARWDEKGLSAQYSYSDGYDVWSGNLIWTDAMKSLSFNGDYQEFLITLEQDGDGIPRALRLMSSDGRSNTTDIAIDGRGIRVDNNGEITEITGYFADSNTYRIDVAPYMRNGMVENGLHVDFSVKDDVLSMVVVDDLGVKHFEGIITATEKGEFEALDGSEAIIEVTPEILESLLGAATEEPVMEEEEPIIEEEALVG